MKKYFYLMCLAVLASSCEKEPDFNKLDSDYVVYTDYNADADFGAYKTYFMPDSILEAGSSNKATYWSDENALQLISEIESQMTGRGYQRLGKEEKDNAELGLQVTYVAETNRVITGGGYYGGWWDYGFWGPWWDSWYYSYPISYSYDTGTIIMELIDLTKKDVNSTSNRLPVIWYANAQGYRYSSQRANMQLMLDAIDQAFEQSQYIKKQ